MPILQWFLDRLELSKGRSRRKIGHLGQQLCESNIGEEERKVIKKRKNIVQTDGK